MRPPALATFIGLCALACGGGKKDAVSCGEGTVEVDGECVSGDSGSGDSGGGDSGGGDSGGGDSGGGDSGSGDSGSGEQAPTILSFSTNLETADETDEITFSAVVTDPQGVDDLIGGTLEAPSGAAYGAFATPAAEGAYEITLTWDDLDRVEELEFTTETTRTFRARFYDQGGHEVSAETTLTIVCSREGYGACGGECLDLTSDAGNCGSCGHSCSGIDGMSADPICEEGACVVASDCISEADAAGASCLDLCIASGLQGCASPFEPTNMQGYAFRAGSRCDLRDGSALTGGSSECEQRLFTAGVAEEGVCFCRE